MEDDRSTREVIAELADAMQRLLTAFDQVAANLDHVHADVVGLREGARLYNPGCYAEADE